MKCTKCGNEVEENIKFCPNCGFQMDNNNKDTKKVEKIPWYLSTWFLVIVGVLSVFLFCIPTVILCLLRIIKYKTKRKGPVIILIISVLFMALVGWILYDDISSQNKFDEMLKNGQYTEAQAYLDDKLSSLSGGTYSDYRNYADLYVAQGMNDEAVDKVLEYCNKQNSADIADYIVDELQSYASKASSDKQNEVESVISDIKTAKEEKIKAEEEAKAKEEKEAKAKVEEEKKVANNNTNATQQSENEDIESDVSKDENISELGEQSSNKDNISEDITSDKIVLKTTAGAFADASTVQTYNIADYPYNFKKEAKKAIKLYKESEKVPIEEWTQLEEDGKGYKQGVYGGSVLYYGDLKDGRPDGTGILLGYELFPMYLGEFSKGKYSGFGIEFTRDTYGNAPFPYVKFEGHYKREKGMAKVLNILGYLIFSW